MAAPRKPRATTHSSSPAPVSAPAVARVEKSEVKGSGTGISSVAKPSAKLGITSDQIAKRAYEIYASRGYAPGNPDEDWHEAERQLRAGL